MTQLISKAIPKLPTLLAALLLLGGCATPARQLMPTPALYRQPGGVPVFASTSVQRHSTDVDLLYVTDRGPETTEDGTTIPYGQVLPGKSASVPPWCA